MWLFSVFLYLAILSHYSAAFFALAAGVYALARIADSHLPRKAIIAWAAWTSRGAGDLWVSVRDPSCRNSRTVSRCGPWALARPIFITDSISIFTFTGQNTLNIFLFLFGERYVAWMMLLCFHRRCCDFFRQGFANRATEIYNRAVWGSCCSSHFLRFGALPSPEFILILAAATRHFLPLSQLLPRVMWWLPHPAKSFGRGLSLRFS